MLASWRSERLASWRWLRMKAPSTSRWSCHGSAMHASWPSAKYSTRQHPGPALPRSSRGPCLDGGRGFPLLVARYQRCRSLQQLLAELALTGEELLGELVGAGHHVFRLRQLVGERDRDCGHTLQHRADGVGPGADHVNDGLLASANDLEDLVGRVLGKVAGHCLDAPLCGCRSGTC